MDPRGRHWSVAVAGAVAVHAAIAAAIVWHTPRPGAAHVGNAGIEFSLGPAGGAPGEAAKAEMAVVEASSAPPQEAEIRAVREVAETSPAPPDVSAPPVDTVEPVETPPVPVVEAQTPKPAEVQEVVPVAAAEQVAAMTVDPPPLPRPKPVTPPAPPTAKSLEPELVRQQAPSPASTEAPQPVRLDKLEPTATGSAGTAGSRQSSQTGSADATAGGGIPGATAEYTAFLQAWLERHKQYPRAAQLRRQEGTALLYFVMDRDGRIIDYRLMESSGYGLLDREVVAMIERAQPLPRIPDDMHRTTLELVVPVRFVLR